MLKQQQTLTSRRECDDRWFVWLRHVRYSVGVGIWCSKGHHNLLRAVPERNESSFLCITTISDRDRSQPLRSLIVICAVQECRLLH